MATEQRENDGCVATVAKMLTTTAVRLGEVRKEKELGMKKIKELSEKVRKLEATLEEARSE